MQAFVKGKLDKANLHVCNKYNQQYIWLMIITRRQLIQSVACAGLSSLLFERTAKAFIPEQKHSRRLVLMSFLNTLFIVDAETSALVRSIAFNFIPHSFTPHPLKPGRVWTFQRYHFDAANPTAVDNEIAYAPHAAEFDVNTGEITKRITLPDMKSQFRGHAFFMPGTSIFFVSRIDYETRKGFLTGFDASDGKQVADYQVSNGGIHQCELLSDGTVLAACPGVKTFYKKAVPVRSRMIHYDIQKGKIIGEAIVDDDSAELAHFHLFDDQTYIAVAHTSGPLFKERIGGVYAGKLGDSVLSPIAIDGKPKSVFSTGEMLSVAAGENGTVVLTNPSENGIFVIDAVQKKFIRRLDIKNPWGVVYDKASKRFIINGHTVEILDERQEKLSTVAGLPIPKNLPTHGGHSFLL